VLSYCSLLVHTYLFHFNYSSAWQRLERLPYQNNTCIHWISSTLVNTCVAPIWQFCPEIVGRGTNCRNLPLTELTEGRSGEWRGESSNISRWLRQWPPWCLGKLNSGGGCSSKDQPARFHDRAIMVSWQITIGIRWRHVGLLWDWVPRKQPNRRDVNLGKHGSHVMSVRLLSSHSSHTMVIATH